MLIAQGRLGATLSAFQLSANGLATLTSRGVVGLSSESCAAVIGAVLSERRRHPARTVELVWTGPETKVSGARDTAVVLRELFSRARRSVVIGGFRFDHGATLLEPLHGVMRDHGVTCAIFADRAEVESLIKKEWPFGPPFPDLYFDDRNAQYSSVHAKCVVVDESEVFVTSANFTDRGQRRNVEVGVALVDPHLATQLAQQLMSLVSEGIFSPVRHA